MRKLPLFVHAETLAQMEAALAWAKGSAAEDCARGRHRRWRIASQLKESDTPVIIARATTLPRVATIHTTAHSRTPRVCMKPACVSAWRRKAAIPKRRTSAGLPYEAAMAAAYGLPKEEALKSVTLYPAQLLGVADQLGSLEVGKAATLIVTNGDPLDFPTQIETAYIDGRKIDLTNRQTRLRDKYHEKYRRK
jgi:imidazolonepropionase-like amidohydrolase